MDPATADVLMDFYARGRKSGGTSNAGSSRRCSSSSRARSSCSASNPIPPAYAREPRSVYQLGDLALASRLSFFLWSSLPDEQLIALAAQGKLKQPAVLEQQVRRMLADPRSKTLIDNFAEQWLHLRNLKNSNPDLGAFPDFDDNLRQAMKEETELFFDSIMREDRSVMDLLNADYTFVNERLARHYGMPNIYGSRFRRVQVPNEARRGLLGQASILTVTSYPNRTSPVERGKWILTNLLGVPPQPPPPNIPPLPEAGADGKVLLAARADGDASRQSGVRRLPPVDGSDRVRDGELRRHRPLARRRKTAAPIDASGTLFTGAKLRRRRRPATRDRDAPGCLRRRAHREDADLRGRPRPRALRHARRAQDRPGRAGHRLPLLVDRPRRRAQRAVPDERDHVE